MSYPDARTLLRKYGLRAKKSWGQNFLVDERAFAGIVRESGATPADTVIEIGAGLGTLTARLSLAARRVIAVERDRDMAEILRAELAGDERVEIAEANALTFDYAAVDGGGRPLIVVGNLPYQIATPILFRLLEARRAIGRIVVMLQLEMAERIVARPSTPEYGALSVMVQMAADARIAFRVPAGAFHPAPRVASAVLALTPLPSTRTAITDDGWFSEVVHAAFGQRRKTLRNSLRTVAEVEPIERALAACGIDPKARGETLDGERFARLSEALLRERGGRSLPRMT
jgi:16S rRNA (adenine1518-N6/adenine1519-N6)-dimethyltransferase